MMQVLDLLDLLGLFLLFVGFIVGLGAVTVIDLHGFLGRKSSYWTEATIRTHKVTKPLIWLGMCVALGGGLVFYRGDTLTPIHALQVILVPIMILNGIFLSFVVSPFLLKREKEGKAQELLPASLQIKITMSFVISFMTWWASVLLVCITILNSRA